MIEVPGFCSECGRQTDTLPCPHCIASVTQPAPIDEHLRRCRACRQWRDTRTACLTCHPRALCPECLHLLVEHSSEPGIGCLHMSVDFGEVGTYCSCALPGTSQADQ